MITYAYMSNKELLIEWLNNNKPIIELELKRRNITINELKKLYPELLI